MNHADSERAIKWIMAQASNFFKIRAFFKYLLRLQYQLMPDISHANFCSATLKNRDAQLIFQFFNRNRQSRLANKTGIRGATKMFFAGDSNNIFKLG